MKPFMFLLFWSLSFALTEATFLLKKRKEGKEYLGRSYVVMEGHDLTMPCHSRPKYGRKDVWAFFWQVLPRQIGKTWYNTINLVSQYPMRKPFTLNRFSTKYEIKAKLLPNTRKLFIKNITRNASAKYRCVVISKTKHGQSYIEVTYYSVIVKGSARIISSSQTAIYLTAGNELEIKCVSNGYPIPEVTWTRNESLLHERSFEQQTGSTLLVKNVGQTDAGIYTCNASNLYGSDFKRFIVYITVPARIITEKTVAYGAIGEDIKMHCEAVGTPKPTFVWKWKSKDELIYLNEISDRNRIQAKVFHGHECSASIISIHNIQPSDFRRYACSAKNIYGFTQLHIRLMEYSIPKGVTILGILSFGVKVDIFWKYGNDGGKNITTVLIEYTAIREYEDKWENITIVNPLVPRYTLRNLHPKTEYKIRLIAFNEIGKSLPSAIHKITTGIIGRPRPPKVKRIVSHHNYVYIVWELAENEDYNQNIEAIIIEYAHAKNGKRWKKVFIKNPDTRSFSIANLCPETNYKFRLFVKNEYGKSKPTQIQHIKTDVKLPTLAVPTVELVVSWSYPEQFEREIKTLIISYVVTTINAWSNVTISNPNTTCYVIKNLYPSTNYVVQLNAIDGNMEKLNSTLHYVTTVSLDGNKCSVRRLKNSTSHINMSLMFNNNIKTNVPAKSMQNNNQSSQKWLDFAFVTAAAAVVGIVCAVVWIWRQKRKTGNIVEQLNGNASVNPSSKDRETVL